MNYSSIRDQITSYFDKSELRNLCFDLDIKYENLRGETLDEKTIALIEYCQRRNIIDQLLDRCHELRPEIVWDKLDSDNLSMQSSRPPQENFQATSSNVNAPINGKIALDDIIAPGGTVRLDDKLYVERSDDQELKRNILNRGTITTIRAPRQAGKSSLLLRGMVYAKQNNATVISIDMQEATDSWMLQSFDEFLLEFAKIIADELSLDIELIDEEWQKSLAPKRKLTKVFQQLILPEVDNLLVLGLDEVDVLLDVSMHTEFFSLIRSWHNKAATGGIWDQLNIVMCISTEPHLLIADKNQSPFNVGLRLYLQDFNEDQVKKLNAQHGSPLSAQAMPDFMNLLQGHPYLVRQALFKLVTKNLSWEEFRKNAATQYDLFGSHLQRHLELVKADPKLTTAMKRVIRNQKCDDELSLFRLVKAGLVKGQGNTYICRCDLYHQYFSKKL